jgi:hypothetical protein
MSNTRTKNQDVNPRGGKEGIQNKTNDQRKNTKNKKISRAGLFEFRIDEKK